MSSHTFTAFAPLADQLEARANDLVHLPVVSGFDAFVDEVIEVVAERSSPEAYQPMAQISELGGWVNAIAGKSGLREAVHLEVAAGGCTVNLGDGIATMGFPLDAFAGVGTPAHPAFEAFCAKCQRVEPLGMEPGKTVVMEFQDGKVMLCSFSHLAGFTPDYLRTQLADGRYLKACQQAQALVLTTWSVYPYMTDCWQYLQAEVFRQLTHRPHLFLDLADPASRAPADLRRMFNSLAGFDAHCRTTLSLNGNEANQLARVLGLVEADEAPANLQRLATELRERARISEVGIHLVKSATAATAEGAATVEGPYCAQPKKSVGAGDRYNAGHLAGLLLELDLPQRLALGVATSGYFVRAARSGNWPELVQFLRTGALT